MNDWEYLQVNLNTLPDKHDEIDVLNGVGAQGWELIAISCVNIATLKRPLKPASAPTSPRPKKPPKQE